MKKLLLFISFVMAFAVVSAQQAIFPKLSMWKYLNINSAPPSTWNASNFNDTSWPSGAGEFGFGEDDEATVLVKMNPSITYYFRKKVTFSTSPSGMTFNLNFKHDDGAIVYVNGVEVIRTSFMPAGPVTYTTETTDYLPTSQENTYISYTIQGSSFQVGENTIAIEVHNQRTTSSDVSFDAELVFSSTLSTIENTLKNKISVYPTVLKKDDLLNVNFLGSKGVLHILSSEGRLVKTTVLIKGINKIPTSFSSEGVYFYSIADEKENIISGKIIVK